MTPAVAASLSVEVLSSIFHVELAEVNVRQIIVDEFPIPNTVAMLTTQDFFILQDTLYENTSFYNAETLATNYYLHHWEIVSASPFVPAILFTVGDTGTTIPTVKPVGNRYHSDGRGHRRGGHRCSADRESDGHHVPRRVRRRRGTRCGAVRSVGGNRQTR